MSFTFEQIGHLLNPDPLDPRLIDFDWADKREHYIRTGDREDDFKALVDYDDYLHFVQWRWSVRGSKRSTNKYVARFPSWDVGGKRQSTSMYLHVEIQKRVSPPPTLFHTEVDHINRKTWDCRKANLRWATVAENTANRSPPAR